MENFGSSAIHISISDFNPLPYVINREEKLGEKSLSRTQNFDMAKLDTATT